MPKAPKEIDVAWTPQAQIQLSTPQEPLLIQSFKDHRLWLRDQKEDSVQRKALEKIDQVYSNCQEPVSCAAGCAACCHAKVDVSHHEKRLILAHIKDQTLSIDSERLALQTSALSEGRWDQLPFADRRCVLLDASNRCTIYAARPLLCRRYFVTSDKKFCADEDWTHIVRQTNPDADGCLSAIFTKFKFEALPVFISAHRAKFSNAKDHSA